MKVIYCPKRNCETTYSIEYPHKRHVGQTHETCIENPGKQQRKHHLYTMSFNKEYTISLFSYCRGH